MKIFPCFILCVLFLPGPILRAAPGSTAESAARAAAAAGAAAQQTPPSASMAPHSPVNYLATKEQADHIGILLKNKQVSTDYIASIFERNPTNTGEYRVRADVEVIAVLPAEKSALDFVPLGHVYATGEKIFYLQWDGLGASTLHYYGPFYGTSETVLGLARPGLRSGASAAPAFGPVIEGVIGYGPFLKNPPAFNLDAGKPVALSDNDLMSEQAVRRAGVNLYFGPVQNDLNHLTALDLRLVPLGGPAAMRPGLGWSQEESAANVAWENTTVATVREAIAKASEDSPAIIGTYAFSTGTNIGLLQIIGPNRPTPNSIDGVKFRYKLVQADTN